MAETILINSGVVQKHLETTDGKSCDIVFNPTDSFFIEKLFAAFETLDKKQEEYAAKIKEKKNNREVFDIARKMDEEVRDIIREVFDFDVCAALFSTRNVYAMGDGFPIWANLLLGIMDEVDTAFAREQKATNPRVARYTKKYHK